MKAKLLILLSLGMVVLFSGCGRYPVRAKWTCKTHDIRCVYNSYSDAETVFICNSKGNWIEGYTCNGFCGEVCNNDGLPKKECERNDIEKCIETHDLSILFTCKNGFWQPTVCDSGLTCVDNECVNPNEINCSVNDDYKQCMGEFGSGDGAYSLLVTCRNGYPAVEICRGEDSCVDGACVLPTEDKCEEGSQRCDWIDSLDRALVTTCENGKWVVTYCKDGELCSDDGQSCRSCIEGETQCRYESSYGVPTMYRCEDGMMVSTESEGDCPMRYCNEDSYWCEWFDESQTQAVEMHCEDGRWNPKLCETGMVCNGNRCMECMDWDTECRYENETGDGILYKCVDGKWKSTGKVDRCTAGENCQEDKYTCYTREWSFSSDYHCENDELIMTNICRSSDICSDKGRCVFNQECHEDESVCMWKYLRENKWDDELRMEFHCENGIWTPTNYCKPGVNCTDGCVPGIVCYEDDHCEDI